MKTSPDSYLEGVLKDLDKDIEVKRYCLAESNKATQKDIDHIIGIIKEYAKDNAYNIRIFVDMHGGFRTNVEMMSIIFSLLPLELAKPSEDGYAHEPIQINADDIYSVTFGGGNNGIIPAGDGYRLLDLVSGIHEFVQYGRVDSLNRYVKNDKKMEYYVKAMRDMADGISMGNIQLFKNGLEDFRSRLQELESISSDTTNLLAELLKQEYEKILSNDDIRNLIEWSMSKQFYQFAITLCTSNVIPFLEENKVLDISQLAGKSTKDFTKEQRMNRFIKWFRFRKTNNLSFFFLESDFHGEKDNAIRERYYYICCDDKEDSELLKSFLEEHHRIKETRDNASHIGDGSEENNDDEQYHDAISLKKGIERYIGHLDEIIDKKISFEMQYVKTKESYQEFKNRYPNTYISKNSYDSLIKWIKNARYKKNPHNNFVDNKVSKPKVGKIAERVPKKEKVEMESPTNITGAIVQVEQPKEEVVKKQPPHWIHHTKEDPRLIGGVIYLPTCDCSECGFTVNLEKKKCPHCGAVIWK